MFDRLLYLMSRGLMFVAGIGLVLMMLQTVLDVVADNLFRSPIPGNLEVISVYHMVLVVFLPLALVEWRHENIQVDLFFLMMPDAVQRIVLALGYATCTIFFIILCWQTATDAISAMHRNELMMAAVYVTIWPAKFVLPIGFGSIALVTFRHMLRAMRGHSGGFEPAPREHNT